MRPGLRRKGASWYFDTRTKPRRWIPLGRNEAEALRKYDQLAKQAKPTAGTVDAMLGDYLAHPRAPLAKGTAQNYAAYRGHLSAVFGYLRPDELTQAEIIRYLRSCPRKTARNEIGLLSLAYVGWIDEGRLTFNPCFGVKVRLPASRRTRLLLDGEIDAIIGKADERLAVAIELAYALGLRIGDLCRLRWNDLAGHVETGKTGARQAFEATEALTAILTRARTLQDRVASLYVLCNSRGKPWTPDALRRHWHKARKAAGVEDAIPHDLRAKAGTDADRQGHDAQKFLGHKSRRTTEVYLRDRRVNVVLPMVRKAGK